MNLIRNLKIRIKFIIIFVFSVMSIGVVSIAGIFTLNSSLDYQTSEYIDIMLCVGFIKDMDFNFSRAEIYLRNFVLTEDPEVRAGHLDAIHEFADGYSAIYKEYEDQLVEWEWEFSDEYSTLMIVGEKLAAYEILRDEIIQLSSDGYFQEAVDLLNNEAEPIGIEIDNLNLALYEINNSDTAATMEVSRDTAASSAKFIIIFSLITVAILIVLLVTIASLIIRPVIAMSQATERMARGDLDVHLKNNSKDEVGILSSNLLTVNETIRKIISDITVMSQRQKAGDFDYMIDESCYEGSFKTVTSGINTMSVDNSSDIKKAMQCIEELGKGNFEFSVPSFPGKKEFIKNNIEHVKNNLKNVNTEINRLVQNAVTGNLSERSDSSHFNGDWFKIINGINNLLDSITEPLTEASVVLKEMSTGNLNKSVTGDYKGDFKELKDSINTTAKGMISNVSEILDILEDLSNKNKNLNITVSRDYSAAFVNIKNGLNALILLFSKILSDISSASEQVDAGSKQVSVSSGELSMNSETQANSVLELTNSIEEITSGIKQNHENSKTASDISAKTTLSVTDGNAEMHNLLKAMDNIQSSSNKIIQVINIIDDIAFQTNLLALNAAVEAARAGEHGKGFVVVVEEVRNLANRSKQAAAETASLIEDSIRKVGEGSKIVHSTAAILDTISSDTEIMSKIISRISDVSEKQADIISSINADINRISQSTNENTVSAQDTAVISEKLLQQSSILSDLVSKYSI